MNKYVIILYKNWRLMIELIAVIYLVVPFFYKESFPLAYYYLSVLILLTFSVGLMIKYPLSIYLERRFRKIQKTNQKGNHIGIIFPEYGIFKTIGFLGLNISLMQEKLRQFDIPYNIYVVPSIKRMLSR